MDHSSFCFAFVRVCLLILAGKGLTSWISFVMSIVSSVLSHWYSGSGVVLDCIDSCSFPFFLSFVTGSLIHEHYTRECEFGNFDKIKIKNNTKKNKTTQKNTKTFG